MSSSGVASSIGFVECIKLSYSRQFPCLQNLVLIKGSAFHGDLGFTCSYLLHTLEISFNEVLQHIKES